MRKAYFSKRHPVGKSRSETQWDPVPIERTVAFCETDYMHEIFLEHLPTSGPILEAGCGLGYYVIYYQELGYEIYGLEWVHETLKRVKGYRPDVGVLTADVHHLPFQSKAFKFVFSGGVVEHFEEGPHQALREAHRVLDDDGLLLAIVPYMNALCWWGDFVNFTLRRKTLNSIVRRTGRELVYRQVETVGMDGAQPEGFHFHLYSFTKREIAQILERAGFEVLEAHGAAVEAGLLEIAWFRALFGRFWPSQRTEGQESSSGEADGSKSFSSGVLNQPGFRQRLKKFLVSEVADSPPARALLRLLREIFGKQLVVVCRKLP
jgi:SAM-dependent methyltransferase